MIYTLLLETLDPFANGFRAMSNTTLACGEMITTFCKLLLPLGTPNSLTFHLGVWDTPLLVSIDRNDKDLNMD
jgi:hypothetical protein